MLDRSAAGERPVGIEPTDAGDFTVRAEDGVFETMLVVAGEPLELEPHLVRLAASVRTLYGASLPGDTAERVSAGARDYEFARIRITVRPAQDGDVASEVRAVEIGPEIVLPSWEAGATLRPYQISAGIGGHKWADRSLLERLEHEASPAVPLLVDGHGAVLEASRANVFVVRGGAVHTAPADGRILPGVTRARVLELARAAGIDAAEVALSLSDLVSADEVFLTGAVRGIEPVQACADATWKPGAVTPRLAAALSERWL